MTINDRQRAAAKAITSGIYATDGQDPTEVSLRGSGRTTHQLGVVCALIDLGEEVTYFCANSALITMAKHIVKEVYGPEYVSAITFVSYEKELKGRAGKVIYDHLLWTNFGPSK